MSAGEPETRAAGRRRSAAKRQSILRAARALFLRDGYVRTTMDAIAAGAGVSKRTLYSHFADKDQLFRAVVEESTAEVTRQLTALADRHLGGTGDLERRLIEFGRAWASTDADDREHQGLVLLILSEARHFPEIARTWRELGPQAVHRALAGHLARLAEEGLLAIEDADEAARHFTALVTNPVGLRSLFGAIPLEPAAVDELVVSGVRAFLRLYGRDAARRRRAAGPAGGCTASEP
jgi:AcrR family transcriptional regulator